jgi:hypothetical protein
VNSTKASKHQSCYQSTRLYFDGTEIIKFGSLHHSTFESGEKYKCPGVMLLPASGDCDSRDG